MSATDTPLTPKNSRGIPLSQHAIPEGSRLDICSPNWCDRTTWTQGAIRIEDETLTDSGDGLTFESNNQNWIDVVHGKIFNEWKMVDELQPVVKVDGVEKEEKTLDEPEGDYTIDYEAGTVTFDEAVTGVVMATYSHENGSVWIVAPTEGKVLRLTHIEVQYSDNVEFNDTVQFKVWVQPPGAPEPFVASMTEYKTIMDFILASSISHPPIKQVGSGPRGMKDNVNVLRWPYTDRGSTDLVSSLNMKVTSEGKNHNAFGGSYFIVTMFGVSEDE